MIFAGRIGSTSDGHVFNVKSTFSKLSDADAFTQAGAVMKGIFVDKVVSAQPPMDQATFQAAIDDVNAAVIAVTQSGGGTTMITVKNAKNARRSISTCASWRTLFS